MALQQTTTLTNLGLPLPVAYHHIKDVVVDVYGSRVVIDVEIFTDATARNTEGVSPVANVSFSKDETLPITSMINPQVYGYDYLKTLPEYVGAQDV